ncbi:LexA family transcriptional regulator [Fulvivirga sp. RKSG066]|uniref:XRE family transcriptional regulator n=1 Tax=Fulvivirga aurantia TaxID=2529383 RepID=UPI0012BD42CA|nr:LexA family transcriptional regulator [Fulvivirga aurantia]MTI21622.1 LexA family transcriptional regulator [Fulvivirga aurantia]
MENSDFEKRRITVLRELLGLSQSEFANEVGVSQGALSQLERGKSNISLDTLQKISMAFQVNCNWLVNGQGDIYIKGSTPNQVPVRESIVKVDMKDSALMPLIKEDAHAGYIKGLENTDYLNTLDVYKIPGFERGVHRLFEIVGDSMIPTIFPGEITVSSFIEDYKDLSNSTLCVIITEEAIVAKRIFFYEGDRSILILKSDNSKYKTYTINIDDVKEIWRIEAKITNSFTQDHTATDDKLSSLESDVAELKSQLQNLTKSGGNGSS